MVIVQIVAGYLFNVNIESFDSVYMCSFLLVMLHLHDVVNGAKGMCLTWTFPFKNSPQINNIRLQKTYLHRIYHPLQFQPSRKTQIGSRQISPEQTKLIQPSGTRLQTRTYRHPLHPTQ